MPNNDDDQPVYLVLAIDIHDPEVYAGYNIAARKALDGYEFEMLSIDGAPQMYEGQQPANHLAIIRFASAAAYDRFYRSDAYTRLAKPLREASSTTRFIMAMKPFVTVQEN